MIKKILGSIFLLVLLGGSIAVYQVYQRAQAVRQVMFGGEKQLKQAEVQLARLAERLSVVSPEFSRVLSKFKDQPGFAERISDPELISKMRVVLQVIQAMPTQREHTQAAEVPKVIQQLQQQLGEVQKIQSAITQSRPSMEATKGQHLTGIAVLDDLILQYAEAKE